LKLNLVKLNIKNKGGKYRNESADGVYVGLYKNALIKNNTRKEANIADLILFLETLILINITIKM
jgi:hypothetical protein